MALEWQRERVRTFLCFWRLLLGNTITRPAATFHVILWHSVHLWVLVSNVRICAQFLRAKKKRYRLRLSLRNTYTYGQRIPPTNDRIFCMIKYEETRYEENGESKEIWIWMEYECIVFQSNNLKLADLLFVVNIFLARIKSISTFHFLCTTSSTIFFYLHSIENGKFLFANYALQEWKYSSKEILFLI